MADGQSGGQPIPGPIVLFGSGETSSSGRKAFEWVMRRLPTSPRVVLLETPAGFEVNSEKVIGRVAEFLKHRLQNFNPQVTAIPARQRGTPFSPDKAEVVAPLLQADLIFMGPGSPTYAIRQLRDSLAWHFLVARHRLGAALALASAAAIAISRYALPVYEIYKVGEDLHWKPGLDFFGPYGLPMVFIPHWNNNDGGEELDTSRCFMGRERFARLLEMLPADQVILGIEEKTALILDPGAQVGQVMGLGGVTLLRPGGADARRYGNGETFPLTECCPLQAPVANEGLPPEVWQAALQASQATATSPPSEPPAEVQSLLARRQQARQARDWATADALRLQISALGWEVRDTPEGQRVVPRSSQYRR